MNNLWEKVQALYGVRSFTGCPDAQIERLREKFGALPQMVEEFYRTAAASEAFRHGQDRWVMPKEYEEKTTSRNRSISFCSSKIRAYAAQASSSGICTSPIRPSM